MNEKRSSREFRWKISISLLLYVTGREKLKPRAELKRIINEANQQQIKWERSQNNTSKKRKWKLQSFRKFVLFLQTLQWLKILSNLKIRCSTETKFCEMFRPTSFFCWCDSCDEHSKTRELNSLWINSWVQFIPSRVFEVWWWVVRSGQSLDDENKKILTFVQCQLPTALNEELNFAQRKMLLKV